MHQALETASIAASPGRVPRRGPVVAALCAALIVSAAASAGEADRVSRPYVAAEQGIGLDVPRERPATLDAFFGKHEISTVDVAENPSSSVRSAAWLESIDSRSDATANDASELQRVALIAAESEDAATSGREPTATPDESSGTAGTSAARTGVVDEPLARLAWPEATGRIDPEQTLRDWAEGAGLLLGFGIVSLWLVRQWVSKRAQPGGPTTHLRTIETLSLPQRCRIHLVEVQGRQVLVAMDGAGVKSVTVLPDRFASLLDPDASDAALNLAHAAAGAQPERDGDWSRLREMRTT